MLEAIRDAGGTLVYVLGIGARRHREARRRAPRRRSPTSPTSSMSELFGGPLLTEFSRSLTRARVQQYQRYFSDADRVLILLHNDPGPRRDGQRPRAAQRAAAHEDDGHHRRACRA